MTLEKDIKVLKGNLWQKNVKCILQIGLLLCTCLVSTHSISDEIYVITLNQNFTPLSKNQVKMIFRGKSTRLAGTKITLLDLSENSNVRASFYQNLLRKNSTQMQAQWASLAFSGKPNTPKELPENDFSLVLLWLEENPNGIAYYQAPLPDSTLNVLYKQDVKK